MVWGPVRSSLDPVNLYNREDSLTSINSRIDFLCAFLDYLNGVAFVVEHLGSKLFFMCRFRCYLIVYLFLSLKLLSLCTADIFDSILDSQLGLNFDKIILGLGKLILEGWR